MKITAIETILIEEFPNLAWLRVATDEGLERLAAFFKDDLGTSAPPLMGDSVENARAGAQSQAFR